MATTTTIGNTTTGTFDTGEASKIDTTTTWTDNTVTKGSERYHTLENRGWTRTSTGSETEAITQTTETRTKRGRWIWYMIIWRERQRERYYCAQTVQVNEHPYRQIQIYAQLQLQ